MELGLAALKFNFYYRVEVSLHCAAEIHSNTYLQGSRRCDQSFKLSGCMRPMARQSESPHLLRYCAVIF